MESRRVPALLRVQLTDATLRQFKVRAATRGCTLELYADMIFHYLIRERGAARWIGATARPGDSVYFLVEVPLATKIKLSRGSQRQQIPLAAFSGWLIDAFLREFEKDPRDFAMIHYVSSRLDQKAVLSEGDLRIALSRCEGAPGLRLPPGHMAKWYYSRLKPLLGRIERDGKLVELTVEMFTTTGSLQERQSR